MPGQYKKSKSGEKRGKLTSPQKKYTVISSGALPKGGTMQKSSNIIDSMNLNELLEASKIVDMYAKGEAIPEIVSPKAEAYAEEVLKLSEEISTRPMAEDMMSILTKKIIEINKRTTNHRKSLILYHKLMAEE